MSEIRNMEKWNTAKDLAEHWGKTTRTINGWWNAEFRGVDFDVNAKISPEREQRLYEKYVRPREEKTPKSKRKKTPRTYTVTQPAPKEAREEAGRAKFEWPKASKVRAVAFNVIAVGVVVGHGALIWYECIKLWGKVGFFGGLVVFMVVLLAVLLASDPSKNRTSSYALCFMACVDTAAYWVHYPSFVNYSIDDAVRMGVCIFICACSFVALVLFRDYKLD